MTALAGLALLIGLWFLIGGTAGIIWEWYDMRHLKAAPATADKEGAR